jgi:carboxymethylenebutenolidase
MNKKEPNQEVFNLYDDYCHNRLERRDFVKRLSAFAVGGWTVSELMSYLLPNYAAAKRFERNDPRLKSEFLEYNSPKGAGKMRGLLSRAAGSSKKLPGIIVVHENRGLNPYVEDTAHQAALDGFISFAPDALTPFGGYPGTDDEGRTMQAQRNRDEILEDFIAAYEMLKNHPECNGNVGVVGFCFGAWISNMMAVRVSDLKAAVPFYGGQAPAEMVSEIQAPLQLHFAELDTRVNEGWPTYEAALKENGKSFESHFYPAANHGFHNH